MPLTTLFVHAQLDAPEKAKQDRLRCVNQLKQVGLAFHNFHDVRGAFPQGGYNQPCNTTADPNDRREWSWCFHILPFLEHEDLFRNPSAAVGAGNVAVLKGDAEFAYPIGTCTVPVLNRDFTLKLNNGGNPFHYSGPISGSGKVEIRAAGPNGALTFDGKAPMRSEAPWT